MSAVYLDNAAGSLLREETKGAIATYLEANSCGANPNALHAFAKREARTLDGARAQIARALGRQFRPSEVHFCSGGTESDNICVLGLATAARKRDAKRDEVILSSLEHPAVAHLKEPLEAQGFTVHVAPATREGIIDIEAFSKLLGPHTALASVLYVSNELGTVQPIAKLSRIAKEAGALFHSDAVQAYLHTPLELANVDTVSLSAHKIGALNGCGAFCIKTKTSFEPTRYGGVQEAGFRAGTQGALGAFVFGMVSQNLVKNLDARLERTASLQMTLLTALFDSGCNVSPTIQYDNVPHIPGIVSLHVPGAHKDQLLLELDQAGFFVSGGSACTTSKQEDSPVLKALGLSSKQIASTIRVSFDERTQEADLLLFAKTLAQLSSKRVR